jgi:hypothetical protein
LVTYIAQKSYGARQSTLKRLARRLAGELSTEFGEMPEPYLPSVLNEMQSLQCLTGNQQKRDMAKNIIFLEKQTAHTVKVK